jgi:Icc protein
MHEVLRGGGFQFLGDARLGGWQVVLLDTHVPRDPAGRLRDAELARLERTLRDGGDRPALVCLHHPPASVGSPWLDGVGLRNGDALLRVVEAFPQVRAVLAGHVHQAFDRRHGDVRLLASPSTCAQFTPHTDDCVMDLRPPGYRRLTLHDDGRVDTEVHWLDGWRRAAPPRDTRGPEPSSTS